MSYLFSIVTGLLLGLMISLNGSLGNAAGNYASSVIIHAIGLIGILLVLFLTKSKLKNLKQAPFYLYTGGLIGILTVIFCNLSYQHLGTSLTVALGLFGQLLCSILIDHFGLFHIPVNRFNKKKILGLIIISVGIFVMTLKP